MDYIVTHDGKFHADEVCATVILEELFPDSRFVRSRDPEIIKNAAIAYDVGGGKYDHHMRDNRPMRDKMLRNAVTGWNNIPYSSFGLIWRDFGKKFLKEIDVPENLIDYIWETFDNEFVIPIDMNDNGFKIEAGMVSGLIEMIAICNATYIERVNHNRERYDFRNAVELATQVIYRKIRHMVADKLSYDSVKKLYEGGSYLILNEDIDSHEFVHSEEGKDILFVVFPRQNGTWGLRTVNVSSDSFIAKKNLPAAWGGLNDEELDSVTGVEGCTFCHPGLFTCANKTKDGILKMLDIALKD